MLRSVVESGGTLFALLRSVVEPGDTLFALLHSVVESGDTLFLLLRSVEAVAVLQCGQEVLRSIGRG